MSIVVHVSHGGERREIIDYFNPRVYIEEWRCCRCREWTHHEDVIWSLPDGTLSTTEEGSEPYCQDCAPEEPEGVEAA